MSSVVVAPFGEARINALASSKVAVYSKGKAQVYQQVGYPNIPSTMNLLGTVSNGQTVYSITNASLIVIKAGAQGALYDTGTDSIVEDLASFQIYATPGVLNATGSLTAAMMLAGIVTSTTAAAVAGTVPTGTVMDAALLNMQINDSIDWSVINTGGSNAFTVTAASGHTLVGAAAVAASTSGRFRTAKTATSTYITYRLS